MHLAEAHEFVCLISAWDLMLGEEVGAKQRKADGSQLKAVAKQNAPNFPSLLMQLVDKWTLGADIITLLP